MPWFWGNQERSFWTWGNTTIETHDRYKNSLAIITLMSDTVCIPKEEYDFRLKCKHVVTSEFSEKFSDAFIQSVRESEESYKRGEFVRVKNTKERRILFDSL